MIYEKNPHHCRLEFFVGQRLPAEKVEFWDEKTHGFVVEPGAVDVMVGASAEDIRLRDQLEVIP
jgi:hypothetical protein